MSVQDQANSYLQKAANNVDRCRKGNARVCFVSVADEPLAGAEVAITQKTQDFLFGNLIFDLIWGDPCHKPELFKERFLELFNFAIFPFYWSSFERTPGRMDWHRMLPVLDWCRLNGVTAKGHPLVWPYTAGVPEWLYDMPEDAVEPLIQARVLGIVRGFEPHIRIWDVTNEGVNHISWAEATHPSFRQRYHEIGYWRGIPVSGAFKRFIPIPEAVDWVEKAFRWAYAANPKATLILNDYDHESVPEVRQRFYDMVVELKKRNVPVSGLGLQWHPADLWISPQQTWETLETYADLGIPIHITELHQPSWEHEIEGGWRQGTWTESAQAEFIEQLYRQFFGHPSVVSINYWGFSDRYIWMDKGGLVDAEYQPKPVFTTLIKLIRNEWMTPAFNTRTDLDGCVDFRGFFGEYEVELRVPGRKHPVQRIHLAQNAENQYLFRV